MESYFCFWCDVDMAVTAEGRGDPPLHWLLLVAGGLRFYCYAQGITPPGVPVGAGEAWMFFLKKNGEVGCGNFAEKVI